MLKKNQNKFSYLFSGLLVAFLIMSSGGRLIDSIHLNLFAIGHMKESKKYRLNIGSSEIQCHIKWLQVRTQNFPSTNPYLSTFLPCSPIYMDMIRTLAPTDANLATQAHWLYPDQPAPLYWLGESNGPYGQPQDQPYYEQIVAAHPNEGLAWCYLGGIYENQGNPQEALDARINCCYNGDPGSNGCYHAGRLYEEKQQYDKAIHFYRLSKWEPSNDKARLLESQLSK